KISGHIKAAKCPSRYEAAKDQLIKLPQKGGEELIKRDPAHKAGEGAPFAQAKAWDIGREEIGTRSADDGRGQGRDCDCPIASGRSRHRYRRYERGSLAAD